ncbi:hypothetical protein BV25DRAFT_1922198 [Artomyces pyxidatus]|uniref:Uncharacterized protein n=1 Tax=Artomyces pyxidatus TaxID=48021 RepID=A0ACB8SER6_9AGAM|nr:hypothetical protein BV25DRAFT_1922198 [Artomyces pyxidatus]
MSNTARYNRTVDRIRAAYKNKTKKPVNKYYAYLANVTSLNESADGRRLVRRDRRVAARREPEHTPAPEDGSDFQMDADALDCDHGGDAGGEESRGAEAKKRYLNSDYPLATWVKHRSEHRRTPLHRVERWNGEYFEPVSLRDLGLRIQLGHLPGRACKFPEPGARDFVAIDVNGIHSVALDFCGCSQVEHRIQLLRAAWWPATPIDPQTAATFAALDLFQRLNLQGKLNVYDYWNSLVLKTDNTGLKHIPDRLPTFTVMAREFAHVRMGKRAGCAHVEGKLETLAPGELAIKCMWTTFHSLLKAYRGGRWLYRPIFCMDANFRLKNRLRAKGSRDVSLGGASGYFVDPERYSEYILNAATQEEISTCTGFAALSGANTKRSKGLRVTGVGAVTCRHEFWQPNGVGDLQKGERYCNMDFIFFSAFSHSRNKSGVISYDIACQWSKNMWSRMDTLPEDLQVPRDTSFTFAVPKFHLPAHGTPCHGPYSFNFLTGVGRTDGEGVERNWANMNGAASSTKQMGPGARQDALDSHCGHANWRKTVGFGKALLRRLVPAVSEALRHGRILDDFNKVLEIERPGSTSEWEQQIVDWEQDKSKPCPYDVPKSSITMAGVRLEMAEQAASKGVNDGVLATMSYAELFFLAMEIEEVQRGIAADRVSKPTDSQAARLQERQNAVAKRVVRFRVQASKVFPLRAAVFPSETAQLTPAEASKPEGVPLPLPSSTPSPLRERIYSQDAIDVEAKIRLAEATEALDRVRHHLRMRTYLNAYKIKNVTGQGACTRAQSLQSQVDAKVNAGARRYRNARRVYQGLVGDGDWQLSLQELKDEDVRGLSERVVRENERAEERLTAEQLADVRAREGGEGRRTLSWLWYSAVAPGAGGDPVVHAAVRTEWAKSRARAKRWNEEVRLARMEMQRVLLTFHGMANAWRGAITSFSTATPEHLDGLNAYAAEHAALYQHLGHAFEVMWKPAVLQANIFLSHPDIDEAQEHSVSSAINAIPVPRSHDMEAEYVANEDGGGDGDDDDDDDD